MAETKPKSRRQMVEVARRATLEGKWDEAIKLNLEIIERIPRDADAYNRLGRAHLEFGRYRSAYDAYAKALEIDRANMIARRNLQRLDLLRHRHTLEDATDLELEPAPIPRTSVFIEEVGKTWVDELVNPASMDDLAEVYPGEQVQMVIEDDRLFIARADGMRLGEVEAKTAERVIELMSGGNRYEAYALGRSAASIRIILREVYRDQRQPTRVSFPRQITATRQYLRERDLLRQRDEADFLLLDDDDDELEEEEPTVEAGDEEEAVEPDPEVFLDEPAPSEDEEPQI